MEDILLPEKEAPRKVHHGKGVRFLRETLNISQSGLGQELGITQQEVSRIEKSETLSDKKILQIAQFFNIPEPLIRNFSPEENAKNVITGNKFDNKDSATGLIVEYYSDPAIKRVYDQLLAEKDKVIALKDELIAELRRQLGER